MKLANWKKNRLARNRDLARNGDDDREQYPDGTFLITLLDMQSALEPDVESGYAQKSNGPGLTQLPQSCLAAVLGETPDFVGIADAEGNLLFVNAAGRKMIGLEQTDSLASMKIFNCHPEWACGIIQREGIPTAMRDGFWLGESAVIRPGGVETPVSQVIVAHRNGEGQAERFSTILRDITERKRAEMIQARLRRQMAMRASVTALLTERLVPLSEVLRRCSESIAEHLDATLVCVWLFEPEEPAARACSRAFDPGEFDFNWLAEMKRPYSTNDAPNDSRIGNKDWIKREGVKAFAGFPLMAGDRMVGAMDVFAGHCLESDTLDELALLAGLITRGVERRRDDEDLAQSLAREREARLAAEEASRLKDELLAMISHELRAPLTSILGWTQMLRAGGLDESSVTRALTTIERNVTTQTNLIEDLLDASRIATCNLQIEMRPVDLASIVEAAVDSLRPLIEEKRLRLQMALDPWIGPLNGDQERLKQVVCNLLTNSVKFTPPEGLIEIRLERLPERLGDKALLIVSDTGQGISPEFLPHVFDRFQQARGSSTRKRGGLGLGLAIAKRLVELHGGAIYAFSRGEGQGSDFMVTLPLASNQLADHEAFTPGLAPS